MGLAHTLLGGEGAYTDGPRADVAAGQVAFGAAAQPARHLGLAPGLRPPIREQARQAAADRRAAGLVPRLSRHPPRGWQALAPDPERGHRRLRRHHHASEGASFLRDFDRGARAGPRAHRAKMRLEAAAYGRASPYRL